MLQSAGGKACDVRRRAHQKAFADRRYRKMGGFLTGGNHDCSLKFGSGVELGIDGLGVTIRPVTIRGD
jgi:hypothetical protein